MQNSPLIRNTAQF